MNESITVNTNQLMLIIRRMYDRGEISLCMYAESLRRSKGVD